MLLCIFALTFLYNKLFYSLIYVHFVTSAKIFCQSISLFMFCLLFCYCFSPLFIVLPVVFNLLNFRISLFFLLVRLFVFYCFCLLFICRPDIVKFIVMLC